MNLFFLLVISAVFLMTEAFAENQYGLFMVVKGDVKVISGNKAPFPVKVGSKVAVNDVVTTGVDARAKIVMSDRNVINVSPETRLQITKYANDAKAGTKDVEIKLDQGKVRNNVEQSYDGEKSKFILKTPTAVAGVRGTQFVTSFDSKTQKTQIVTMKGQVTFSSVMNGKVVGAPVVVNKGESTTSSAGAPPEAPKAVPKNELKEIDKDSTAANKTKNETVAEGGKPEGRGREPASEKPVEKTEMTMVSSADFVPMKPSMEGPILKPPPVTDIPRPRLPTPPNFVLPIQSKVIIIPK